MLAGSLVLLRPSLVRADQCLGSLMLGHGILGGGGMAFWGSTAVLAGQGTSSIEQKSLPALGCCSGFVLIERLFSRRRAFLLTSVQM